MQLAKKSLKTLNNFSIYKDKFRNDISQMPLCAEVCAEFIESKRDQDEEAVFLATKLLRFICEDEFNAAEIAAIASVNRAPTPFERLNRTINMMERKAPKEEKKAQMHAKAIKALKALTKTIGLHK